MIVFFILFLKVWCILYFNGHPKDYIDLGVFKT